MASKNDTAMVKRETALEKRPEAVATMVPPADIYETDDAYVVMLDMPGATKESISVNMDRSTLTIRGTAELLRYDDAKLHYNEIRGGVYERSFNLTEGIDRNSVEAHFENGVLTIKLLKKEEVKPRTIPIN